MPTYLRATGMTDLQEIGALSAIPWMVSPAFAEWLQWALSWQCTQVQATHGTCSRP